MRNNSLYAINERIKPMNRLKTYIPTPVKKIDKITKCKKLSGIKLNQNKLPPIFLDDNGFIAVSN